MTRLLLNAEHYSLSPIAMLVMLYKISRRVEKGNINGCYVECGVCDGGSAAIIAYIAKDNDRRHIWLFDSFEGLPESGEKDSPSTLGKTLLKGDFHGSEEKVSELLFDRLGLDDTRIHLVKGWFEDTLPVTDTGGIALLYLDANFYESTTTCLEELYDDVVPNGCIVIDDYENLKGTRDAVDDFIEARGLKVDLIRYSHHGWGGAYFYKTTAKA